MSTEDDPSWREILASRWGGLGTADNQRPEARQLPAEAEAVQAAQCPWGEDGALVQRAGGEDNAWRLRLQRNAIPASPGGTLLGTVLHASRHWLLMAMTASQRRGSPQSRGKRPGLRLRWFRPRASSQSLLQMPLRMSTGDSGWAGSGRSPGEQRGGGLAALTPGLSHSLLPCPTFRWPPGRGSSAPALQPTRGGGGQPPPTVLHCQGKGRLPVVPEASPGGQGANTRDGEKEVLVVQGLSECDLACRWDGGGG